MLIPLRRLSERTGRPWVASAEPAFGLERGDEETLPDGAVVLKIACPSAHVMIHVPTAVPGAACYQALDAAGRQAAEIAWESWKDRFLAAALVEPAMTETLIQDLGPDAGDLAIALLKLWNWIPEDDGSLPHMPGEAFQEALRYLALRLRRAPSELLATRFDEFVLNYRVIRGPVDVPETD